MFRFAHIEFLWLLLAIPVLVALHIWITRRKRQQLQLFGDPELMAELMPNASRIRPHVKFALMLTALSLLIIGIARPQYGTKEQTVKRQGIEVMIALDISNSMLAEDVAPNRLERAKQMLSKLVDQMVDDKLGLVVFAGDAFTQIPITCDYVSAKMYLQSITPDIIPAQGTAIGKAITTCVSSFGTEDTEKSRAIILITDGENHEDDAAGAAKAAAEKGIHVNIVGMGDPKGAPIPIPGSNNYMKDKEGNVVITKLSEQMCQEIAASGDGMYVRADNSNAALKALQKEIDKMNKSELDSKVYSEYDEQFQVFAWIALVLLIVEYLILDRKNRIFRKIKLFS